MYTLSWEGGGGGATETIRQCIQSKDKTTTAGRRFKSDTVAICYSFLSKKLISKTLFDPNRYMFSYF